jgi:hypothetical protein
MKLLICGKPRNIYFKDDTVYYKNNGIKNDITNYFKKTGELKKQYSNLLIENKKRKIIGGNVSFNTFSTIRVMADTDPNTKWDNKTKIDVYEKLLQMFLLSKIRMDNHSTLFDPRANLSDIDKQKFINALLIIAGIYEPNNNILTNIDFQKINETKKEDIDEANKHYTDAKEKILTDYKPGSIIDTKDTEKLNASFAQLNKINSFHNNNISALLTEESENFSNINLDNIKDLLDIVPYQRIVTKLKIIKEINNDPVEIAYCNYQLKALENLKSLMLNARIFESNVPSI